MKTKRKYWVLTLYEECPLCGRSCTYRDRVYGKKPKSENKRHIFKSNHCGCGY